MIVLFIASTTQAMAAVIMPYQMNMSNQVLATQGHCLTSDSEHGMSDPAQDNLMSCGDERDCCPDNERDCCSEICSLSYISSSRLLSDVKPVQEPIQGIENRIIATTNTLYRPPILG